MKFIRLFFFLITCIIFCACTYNVNAQEKVRVAVGEMASADFLDIFKKDLETLGFRIIPDPDGMSNRNYITQSFQNASVRVDIYSGDGGENFLINCNEQDKAFSEMGRRLCNDVFAKLRKLSVNVTSAP